MLNKYWVSYAINEDGVTRISNAVVTLDNITEETLNELELNLYKHWDKTNCRIIALTKLDE